MIISKEEYQGKEPNPMESKGTICTIQNRKMDKIRNHRFGSMPEPSPDPAVEGK